MLRLHGDGDTLLVFLPGFMASAEAYRVLLEPLATEGVTVIVPQLYPRGLAALAGRVSVSNEATAAAELVGSELHAMHYARVVLAGHSRGGQAAWRAATQLGSDLPHALVLIDPVDGEGRRPSAPTVSHQRAPHCPTLIVGAGLGGRCAPREVNHEVFARATPQARHVVIEQLGHADILCGRSRDLGRRLCGGAADPNSGRAECTRLLSRAVSGILWS